MDLAQIEALGDPATDREGLGRLFSLFIETTRGSLEDLRKSIGESDAREIRKNIHQLRGSCATLGAKRMLEILGDIESGSHGSAVAGMDSLLAQLEQAFQETSSFLETHLRSHP